MNRKFSLPFFGAGLLFCFFVMVPVFLYPQTAQKLEDLLNTETVSYEQALWLVMEAAGFSGFSVPEEAFRLAVENQWLPGGISADGPARLDGISLLIMRAFELKGGLMYSLFKNPHYAYRELVYRNIIQGRSDPKMTISGDFLLFLTGKVLSHTDETNETDEPSPEEQRERERQTLLGDISAQLSERALSDATVRIADEGVTISLANLRFVANSSELAETEELGEIAEILKAFPARKIAVSGHTALAGTPEDRLRTSMDRARAVADFFVLQGARRADEIDIRGYGADRPIAGNDTAEGMTLNRRVEITILD